MGIDEMLYLDRFVCIKYLGFYHSIDLYLKFDCSKF